MKSRIGYLDSVRGLAAFSVLVFHVISAHWIWRKPMKIATIFFNGADAVSLFFVLSGLVLSLKYLGSEADAQPIQYRKFVFNRLFRLYPAFWFMLACYYTYQFHVELTVHFWSNFFTNKHHWIQEALLVRDYHNLFLPDWTLGVELAFSLLVPMFIVLARVNQKWLFALMFATLVANKFYISIFAIHFCLGVLIANNFEQIRNYDFKASRWYKFRYLIYLLILLMFSARHIADYFGVDKLPNCLLVDIVYFDWFYLSGIASAAILVIVINNRFVERVLSLRLLLFLGKISYSIYLSHWLFIGYLMKHWDRYAELFHHSEIWIFVFYMAFTIMATLGFSIVLYYCVERPFMKLGKKLSDKLFIR